MESKQAAKCVFGCPGVQQCLLKTTSNKKVTEIKAGSLCWSLFTRLHLARLLRSWPLMHDFFQAACMYEDQFLTNFFFKQ